MSHQSDTCQEKLQKLNQQVSVMRKEIKNLRETLDSATRAHRKHIVSLQSTVSNIDLKELCKAHTQTNISASPVSALEQGVIQTVPIGYLSSCFSAKNGTPRQPTICGPSRAELRIEHRVFNNPEHALVGLEQYSHVWIIFVFHKNGHLSAKAKVKPPRLNGKKVGVYSTRSPHRPNALGLTLAKLDKVQGDTVYLSDIDMIDGTPVLDIKPYIPDYDSIHSRAETGGQNEDCPHTELTDVELENEDITTDTKRQKLECDHLVDGANNNDPFTHLQSALEDVKAYVSQSDISLQEKNKVPNSEKNPSESSLERPCYGEEAYSTIASWIRDPPVSSLEVRFTTHAEKELAQFLPAGCNEREGPKFKFLRSTEEAIAAIRGVLSADPRSVYRRGRCTDKLFYFTLDTADVTCWFGQNFAEVLQIRPVQQLTEVAKD
ncbi:tRNA (adenine(37)-N6)-methyltransferase [Periophthalmus magnuspinnatus]|uniref:tRNA (adenine(37)-N6)-methyltransferase n=1 Tax=Periophthalmus magnuspinnatus TaxID=409849 RepID=UPI00145BC9FB|nr:tRNA (adenine(37)-N6)-methyltransferase [Periophthalmus magnuspinnatus]